MTTVVLLDSSGAPVDPVVSSAAVIVPALQLNSANITRLNRQWVRPAAGGSYQLQFTGGGGDRIITFSVDPPAPNARLPVKGDGLGAKPTDFPVAQESLTLDGFLTTTITIGRPNACGEGRGPSGTIFEFGTSFQVDGVWYSLVVFTDPASRQYGGPGTYTAIARLYGPTQRLYTGTVRLTVIADHFPGPYRGSVQGTIDRVGTITLQPYQSVIGTWTCTPGLMLGPG